MRIQCKTLFDITATGVTGHFGPARIPFKNRMGLNIIDTASWNKSRNQQRNWETITQLISLRAQIVNPTYPTINNNTWTFEFEIDIEGLFIKGLDPLGVLKDDCNGVPMLVGLDEKLTDQAILVIDSNIWFNIISINN